MKTLGIVLAVVVTVIIAVTIGVGKYFVHYAIARDGVGVDGSVTETEVEKRLDEVRKKEIEDSIEKLNSKEHEKVNIKSFDGLKLVATKYVNKGDKWAIVLHGYRAKTDTVMPIAYQFYEKGFNVLVPSMRATNESEGKYIGMGELDKKDVVGWVDYIVSKDKDAKIVLHGSSMGAATVMMTAGEKLPDNVKCIIEDSGYTSIWDIFAKEAKEIFNLPTFPVLDMFRVVARVDAGYDIKKGSALEAVKHTNIPILFIHGDKDDFVPTYMVDILYDAANTKKEKLIIKDAGHTDSKYANKELYYNRVFNFVDKYIKD